MHVALKELVDETLARVPVAGMQQHEHSPVPRAERLQLCCVARGEQGAELLVLVRELSERLQTLDQVPGETIVEREGRVRGGIECAPEPMAWLAEALQEMVTYVSRRLPGGGARVSPHQFAIRGAF